MSENDRYTDTESDAEKRANHNLQERKRRDHIKDSFSRLSDVLPGCKGKKIPRAQVLKKAYEALKSKMAELDEMEYSLRIVKEATKTGDLRKVLPLMQDHLAEGKQHSEASVSEDDLKCEESLDSGDPQEDPHSSIYDDSKDRFSSYSDDSKDQFSSNSDDSTEDRRKRRKISHYYRHS